MSDLKTTFIQRCLAEYMQRTIDAMKLFAQRRGIGVTNEAINSLAYRAYENGSGGSADLSFLEYLRMVDMGAGRSHPLGGLKGMRVALQASNRIGVSQVKDNVRKPKKLYSKTAYGNLSYLQNKLLYGYTEETIARLKEELNNASITTSQTTE